MLLEFRAGCLWLQLLARAPTAAGRAAAATVLADVPKWPYRRLAGDGSRWPEIAAGGRARRRRDARRGRSAATAPACESAAQRRPHVGRIAALGQVQA